MFFMPSIVVNGLLPWISQVISLKTVKKRIDRHKPHAGFDQSSSEQTTLSESIHAVSLANRGRFLRQIKRLARLRLFIKR